MMKDAKSREPEMVYEPATPFSRSADTSDSGSRPCPGFKSRSR